MPAFDYSEVYDLYDHYFTFTADIPFWREVAARDAAVLELMAGTGRISLPLIDAGIRLTCVESNFGMASILAKKARRAASVLCADVRMLPLAQRFQQILLPFQGLSELITAPDREALLQQVEASLVFGGQFICTAHNPPVRAQTLNGEWHSVGKFPYTTTSTVEVSVRATVDGRDAIAVGEQRVVVRNEDGLVTRDHLLPLRFSLPTLEEIVAAAKCQSLALLQLFGGYDRSDYEEATSRVIIVVFRKA